MTQELVESHTTTRTVDVVRLVEDNLISYGVMHRGELLARFNSQRAADDYVVRESEARGRVIDRIVVAEKELTDLKVELSLLQ